MSNYKDALIEKTKSSYDKPEENNTIDYDTTPSKKGNCSYDAWEYAYFPHLVNIYKIVFENNIDYYLMYQFFLFIYNVSSGKITFYLDKLTIDQENLYTEYLIKRDEI